MPDEGSDLARLFQNSFGLHSPFGQREAQMEENLPSYFIKEKKEQVKFIIGNAHDPQPPLLYLGPPGSGKSAMARMVEYLLTETESDGPGLVVRVEKSDFISVFRRFNELERRPYSSAMLELSKERVYEAKLLRLTRQALAEQQSGLEKRGVNFQNFDSGQLKDIKQLWRTLQSLGVVASYFIADQVEEVFPDNLQSTVNLLLPLLRNRSLMSAKRLYFKFFLPIDFEAPLRHSLGSTYNLFTWRYSEWTQAELRQVLEERLSYFSKGQIINLALFSEFLEIDEHLCLQARGLPRNLIILGDILLDQVLKTGRPISETMLLEATEVLYREQLPKTGNSSQSQIIRLSFNDRNNLADILLKLDSFLNYPIEFLIGMGLPRIGALNMGLPINNHVLLANQLILKLEAYGTLPIKPPCPALLGLIDYLLKQGLGLEDQNYLKDLKTKIPV